MLTQFSAEFLSGGRKSVMAKEPFKTIGGYVLLAPGGNPFWQSFRRERRAVWEVFTLNWAQTDGYEYAMKVKAKWEAEGCQIAACRIELFPL